MYSGLEALRGHFSMGIACLPECCELARLGCDSYVQQADFVA